MKALVSIVALLAVSCGGAQATPDEPASLDDADGMAIDSRGDGPVNEVGGPGSDDSYDGAGGQPGDADRDLSSEDRWDSDEYVDGDEGVAGGVVGGVVGGVLEGTEGPPPVPKKDEAEVVPPNALEALRISGVKEIYPSEDVKLALARDGRSRVVANVKICVDETGAVYRTDVLKSSGYPDYDAALEAGMQAWTFHPYTVENNAVRVCSVVTFIYKQS